ncbi:MAG: PSD1 and planctomycete cytochrome C domain-containing protein [Planctomycetota bacterium]
MLRLILTCLSVLVPFATTVRAEDPDFARDVRPILSDACYHCHGPDEDAREAGLRLDDRNAVFESGILEQELLERLTSEDPDLRMPPPDSNRTIDADDRTKLIRWLQSGAKWPQDDRHWAFIPPVRPSPPMVSGEWIRNPIDQFVLARLVDEGLAPSERADRVTLLRRVSLDLTGLPPSPDEVEVFLSDTSPDAYERAVDRLLASPRYGEHMALDWLEASRFADTDGYQNDRYRHMWVWRDWLIQTLNRNMPFDRFVIEQMAGDLLPDRDFMTQVATGFHRNHRINSEGGSIPDEWIVEYVADRVETTGTLFLGLTFNCSRCHDHKYDPIAQNDFYRLFAFFNNIAEAGLGPNNGNSPPFVPVPKSWPDLSDQERDFVEPEPVKIKVVQTSVPRPQPGGPETVMVLHELATPRETFRLIRGQYDQPDKTKLLSPGTPPVLGGWNAEWRTDRLGLAKWLVSNENPLTARVTVNRYWQHFFGLGLVKTSENFGVQGEFPSHPRLLDWLATEFIRTDWDVKAMHRLIVTSATYRQSSVVSSTLADKDPQNRLLARGPRKRLSPFAIRDAVLDASGLLSRRIGGPSVKPYMPPGIWSSVSNNKYKRDQGESLYRRSMYTYWRRTLPPPTMMSFNAAARETCTVRKELTTTPLQALTMMNNITFIEAARHLARRVLEEHPSDLRSQIGAAFHYVTTREATSTEIELLVADYEAYLDDFRSHPKRASQLLQIGDSKFKTVRNPNQLAAMALIANTLFNLDEAITEN